MSPTTEKWLIFVSSKTEGRSLKMEIERLTKRSVYFLTAQGKNSKAWKEIVNNSQLKNYDIFLYCNLLNYNV